MDANIEEGFGEASTAFASSCTVRNAVTKRTFFRSTYNLRGFFAATVSAIGSRAQFNRTLLM